MAIHATIHLGVYNLHLKNGLVTTTYGEVNTYFFKEN